MLPPCTAMFSEKVVSYYITTRRTNAEGHKFESFSTLIKPKALLYQSNSPGRHLRGVDAFAFDRGER